jgi:hypothetical protein
MYHAGFASLLVALSGCGSGLNTNRIWGFDQSTESKLVDAKVAYDKGDFSGAINLTSQILEINPDVEDAAILQGYAYVSLSGLDPYRVASCLTTLSSSSTSTSNSNAGSTSSSRCKSAQQSVGSSLVSYDDPIEVWFAADANATPTSNSSSNNDTNVLRKLQAGLLSMSEEDFAKLKKEDFSGSSGLFLGENTIIIPEEVDDELRESVGILRNLNNAVKSVCRFVNDTTALKVDSSRYKALGCELTSISRKNATKAHYLWAISHLGEALTFTSVILYNTGDSSSYNFQRASTKLQNASTSSVDTIVSQVEDLQEAVAAVFDTENSNSMISKTLFDLNSTSGAFDAIAGLPDSVKQEITKILEGVKTLGKTISGSSGETKALKTRLLDSVTTTASKKINDTIGAIANTDPNNVTPEAVKKLDAAKQAQVAQLCSSYDSLTKDSPADKIAASKPKACS